MARLTMQPEDVLQKKADVLQELMVSTLRAVLRGATQSLGASLTAAATDPSDPAWTRAEARWMEAVSGDFFPHVVGAYADAAEDVHLQLVDLYGGPAEDVPFVNQDDALEYLRGTANRMVRVTEGTWTRARAQLIQGFTAGESIEELSARLQSVTDWSASRAATVARTEIISASNAGALAEVRAVNPEASKEWIATLDDRTRPTHREADHETVLLDGTFSVGADELDFPGDPSGSPGEIISCRCTLAFHIPREAVQSAVNELAGLRDVTNEFDPADFVDFDSLTAASRRRRSFDESKVKRGRGGRFAKKSDPDAGSLESDPIEARAVTPALPVDDRPTPTVLATDRGTPMPAPNEPLETRDLVTVGDDGVPEPTEDQRAAFTSAFEGAGVGPDAPPERIFEAVQRIQRTYPNLTLRQALAYADTHHSGPQGGAPYTERVEEWARSSEGREHLTRIPQVREAIGAPDPGEPPRPDPAPQHPVPEFGTTSGTVAIPGDTVLLPDGSQGTVTDVAATGDVATLAVETSGGETVDVPASQTPLLVPTAAPPAEGTSPAFIGVTDTASLDPDDFDEDDWLDALDEHPSGLSRSDALDLQGVFENTVQDAGGWSREPTAQQTADALAVLMVDPRTDGMTGRDVAALLDNAQAYVDGGDTNSHAVENALRTAVADGLGSSAPAPMTSADLDDVDLADIAVPSEDFTTLTGTQARALQFQMEQRHGAITPEQRNALSVYTGRDYQVMNQCLRGQLTCSGAVQELNDNAVAGMRPTTQSLTTYRNANLSAFGVRSAEDLTGFIGRTVTDQGFFSTSVENAYAATGTSVRMIVRVPEGTPAAYVEHLSENAEETELILAPGTQYRISRVDTSVYPANVYVEVVPRGFAE